MGKKILIITDNIPDQINGVVTTYKNIEPYATRDGYTIDYIDPGRYRYFDCPKYNEIKLAYPKGLGKEIEAIRADYIHIATEGPMGVFARSRLAVLGYRYNTAYHTKFPEAVKKIMGVPEFVTWPMIRWFHSNSNVVLTTTNSMVEQLHSKGFGNNVKSWTRGVDRELFKPIQHKVNKKNPVLVCVSRVSKEKNLKYFFEVSIPGSRKFMVGDGPMLETYKKKYPHVHFVGAKRGKELASYYQKADCFVFPSLWDTFGLVQIEAMACGTPVAAFPVQGPLDVVDHGVTGYLANSLYDSIYGALELDRDEVYNGSLKWSWEHAWEIFRDNLVPTNEKKVEP
jgi:glycosyltransferase involved in cell wall biosynthesis